MSTFPSLPPQAEAFNEAAMRIIDVASQATSDAQRTDETNREIEISIGDYTLTTGGGGDDDDDDDDDE